MTRLRPFFSYYGSKWRLAPRYPAPVHEQVIEPFAGSAGYSLLYPHLRVILCDLDPVVCAVWRYLLRVTEAEIRALPLMSLPECEEARLLVGFWLARGQSSPAGKPSAYMREYQVTHPGSFWSERVRRRIADSLRYVRHWQVVEGSCFDLPLCRATWFLDPPYVVGGEHYRHHVLDRDEYATWVKSLPGQVIACEGPGADYLPFESLTSQRSINRRSEEKVYHSLVNSLDPQGDMNYLSPTEARR